MNAIASVQKYRCFIVRSIKVCCVRVLISRFFLAEIVKFPVVHHNPVAAYGSLLAQTDAHLSVGYVYEHAVTIVIPFGKVSGGKLDMVLGTHQLPLCISPLTPRASVGAPVNTDCSLAVTVVSCVEA